MGPSTDRTRALGDACLAASSASVLAFTVATFLYARPGASVFDEDWVRHGFCVYQKDVPHFNSHDLCLYCDVVLVAIGLLVWRSLRGLPGRSMKYADETMLFGLLGHLGHGVAHGVIGAKYRSDEGVGTTQVTGLERLMMEEDVQMAVAKSAVMTIALWFGLLKGIMARVPNAKVAIAAIVAYAGGLFVIDALSFTYVQAVLAVAFVSTQLTLPREEKDYVYAAFAASSVPVSIVPWIESTACQNVAMKLGGHLIYDVSIPTTLIAAYYASWRHSSTQGKTKET